MDFIEKQMAGMNPQQKRQFLENNAEQVEHDQFYRRELTEDERLMFKDVHMEKSIERDKVAEEFDKVKVVFKEKTKVLSENIKSCLRAVRMGFEERKGTLYYFSDHDEGYMYVYSEDGQMVEKRRLRPEERQTTIMSLKTANQ